MKLFLFIISFTILALEGISQNQKYAIYWGDDEIGSMTVSRVQKGAKVDFNFLAEVEFRVILKYQRTTKFSASYYHDTLSSCSSRSVMNDKLKDYQSTKRKGSRYHIFQHPNDSSILKSVITHSVAKLYYKEPKNGLRKTYAEGYSKFCKLESLGSGKYKLYLTDDKTNIYTYKNGKLDEVEVKRSWFDLVFKRIS